MDEAIQNVLGQLYVRHGVATDKLPYTHEFDELHNEFQNRTGVIIAKSEFWQELSNARKASRLPRLR